MRPGRLSIPVATIWENICCIIFSRHKDARLIILIMIDKNLTNTTAVLVVYGCFCCYAAATRRASVDNAATVPLPSVSEATEREGDSADRGPVPSEPVAIRRQDSTDSADRGPLPSEPEATQKQGSVGSVPCEPVANGRGALPSEPEADRQRNSPPPSEPVATQRQSSVDSANRGPLPPVPGT